jgi:hypothetical protein
MDSKPPDENLQTCTVLRLNIKPNSTNKALMQQQQHLPSVKRDYTLSTQSTTANDNVDN